MDFTPNGRDYGIFKPAYTPERMIELGVFDGAYFSKASRADMLGLSPVMRRHAKEQLGRKPDPSLNAFGVHSGLTLAKWKQKGWIKVDELGWFHWYCRYDAGRRLPELDAWQIGRWKRYAERKWPEIKARDNREGRLSRIERQGLLHWAHYPFALD